MPTPKRGHAINGDLFTLRHTQISLDVPFTTFVDVNFRGVTHQVFAAADRKAFSYEHTTGEFTVAGLHGHVIETLDTVETQVSHRYQAIVPTEHGALSVHSYDSVDSLLSLVGALRPRPTPLGVIVEPDDEVEITTAPRVALQLDIGVVEITPLTAEVIDLLPTWQGTPVQGGELYGGRFTDDAVYLTLVTPTCRVVALPAGSTVSTSGTDEDTVATALAGLEAHWQA